MIAIRPRAGSLGYVTHSGKMFETTFQNLLRIYSTNEASYIMTKLLIVTGFTKTVLNHTFGNSRNTELKY